MYSKYGKRVLDVSFVLLFLPIFFPLLVGASLAVLLFMGRPVFFVQERPGLRGKIFKLIKLRTMHEGLGSDSDRLTGLGKLLRATSLDELPGLWNVLRGDMSLVGPRPLLVQYLERYTSDQMRRHDVRPGVIGWAAVNGRNANPWEEKFRMDLEYVDKLSFGFDVLIVWKAIGTVLFRKGISAPGCATVEEFMGPS